MEGGSSMVVPEVYATCTLKGYLRDSNVILVFIALRSTSWNEQLIYLVHPYVQGLLVCDVPLCLTCEEHCKVVNNLFLFFDNMLYFKLYVILLISLNNEAIIFE